MHKGPSTFYQTGAGSRAEAANPPAVAPHDPVTGLLIRSQFLKRAADVLAHLPDQGATPAVLVIGLDQFAQVTGTFGHTVGDMLLRRAAERLQRILQSAEAIARTGESEFAVLLVASEERVSVAATQVADLLARAYLFDGRAVNVGASLGVVVVPDDQDDVAELYRCAALALSQARADGRGQVRFFDPGMALRAKARRTLQFDLRKALLLREFELHYQPQLNLATGRLSGFEALLRWRHPTRGLVSPGAFLPLAEETGLIVPIGEWALRTACHEAAHWPEDVAVAVNVAAAQFEGGRLVGVVEAALAASGLPHRRLDIEVTEGILLREDGVVADTLQSLHDKGVRISMDDFGTGYSSLTQLKAFPFDKIKIDRSLVTNIAHGPNGAVFVRAIAMLGSGLGMQTMAEGIETVEQLEHVRAEGCNAVQGYLIGKPVGVTEVPQVIAKLHAQPSDFAASRSSII